MEQAAQKESAGSITTKTSEFIDRMDDLDKMIEAVKAGL
jgi:hypothetical protein